MDNFDALEMDFSSEEGQKILAAAEEMKLHPQGLAMLIATERAIVAGEIDPADYMNGQQILFALADELESDLSEANIRKIADKLRMLSSFATTMTVPVPLD